MLQVFPFDMPHFLSTVTKHDRYPLRSPQPLRPLTVCKGGLVSGTENMFVEPHQNVRTSPPPHSYVIQQHTSGYLSLCKCVGRFLVFQRFHIMLRTNADYKDFFRFVSLISYINDQLKQTLSINSISNAYFHEPT